MRMVSLASGSSGNSIYVGSDDTHILVDAGVSNKCIEAGLKEVGLKGDELSAVVITHEHSDHIKGLGVLSRKFDIPIYATAGTLEGIRSSKMLGDIDRELMHAIKPGDDISIGDLKVHPFSIDHDAADPVAYRIEHEDKAMAVATDMGHYTDEIIANLTGLDAALIEANHDIHMLEVGPYPYYLKRRILGDFGHLSNESAGKLICKILHDKMKAIVLGHLSKENNYPDLAYETVRCEIDEDECIYKPDDFPIEVAKRDTLSVCIEV